MIPYFAFTEITFGAAAIQIWGLATAFGFLTALFLSIKEADRKSVQKSKILDITILALIGTIAGSRIFYILLNHSSFRNFQEVINLRNSGFSLTGGIIFSSILVFAYAKLKKIDIWRLADCLTPGAAVAILIARTGCFLVYDHVGRITNLPWGRIYIDGSARHPVSLYNIISLVFILSVIYYLRGKNLKDGVLFLTLVLLYSVSRFFLDFARCYDIVVCETHYKGLTHTQWTMLLAVLLSVVCLSAKKFSKQPKTFNF